MVDECDGQVKPKFHLGHPTNLSEQGNSGQYIREGNPIWMASTALSDGVCLKMFQNIGYSSQRKSP